MEHIDSSPNTPAEQAKDIPKVCPTCKHFYFSPGDYGYSEYTPGSDMSISCEKNYWDIDKDDSDLTYRQKMLMALSCKDYELVKFEVNNYAK